METPTKIVVEQYSDAYQESFGVYIEGVNFLTTPVPREVADRIADIVREYEVAETAVNVEGVNPTTSVGFVADFATRWGASPRVIHQTMQDFGRDGTTHVCIGVSTLGADTGIEIVASGVHLDDLPTRIEEIAATARENNWGADRLWIMTREEAGKIFAERAAPATL